MILPAESLGQAVEDRRTRLMLFAWGSFAGLAAAIVFVGFPGLDLMISRVAFQPESGRFLLGSQGPGEVVRQAFNGFFAGLCAVAAAGIVLAMFGRRLLGRDIRTWLFLGVLLALGPGIVANLIFKDHWGRARPRQTVEFGGQRAFSPALARSDACPRNCSFIGGEASSAYASGFALALLIRRRRRKAMAAALAFGTTAGLIRIGQGAHFASDVIFAGVFMALLAAFTHWLIFALPREIRGWSPGARDAIDQNAPAHSAASRMRSWGRAEPPQ